MTPNQSQSALRPEGTSIAPGAQPFLLPGGQTGVLVLHGYGGSIADYRQFSDELNRRGFTVMGMRLAGHGESLEALRQTSAPDWQRSVRIAAETLLEHCSEIVVVGSSFGGALALNYARNFPDRLRAIIVVNPAVKYRSGGNFQTIGLKILRLFTKDYQKPGLSAADAARYRELGSMTHWPIDGIFETYRFIRTMVLPHLPQISVPTLVMAMPQDPVVHSDSARIIHNQLGSTKKKLVWLPGKTHRPFRDPTLVTQMVEEIANFLAA